LIAQIIVDIKHQAVDQIYDYLIPDALLDDVQKGIRVMVPFGNQTRMGFVVGLVDESETASREIIEILDSKPIISDELSTIIDYLYESTRSLYSSIFETVIPSELLMNYGKVIHSEQVDHLPEEWQEKFSKKGIWRLKKEDYHLLPRLKRLQEQKLLTIENVTKQQTAPKYETVYFYQDDTEYPRLHYYPQLGELTVNESYTVAMLKAFGFSASNVTTLTKNGVFKRDQRRVARTVEHVFSNEDKRVILTPEQQQVSNTLKANLHTNKTFLLHGITGSGKTEIYLDVIEKVIASKKQALVLVPEITLIAPMVQRIQARFNRVGLYHSMLSKGERHDQYHQILNQDVDVVVATRSGVFLPLETLGVIIIDEEHDQAYQQTEGVIYHARDIALNRSQYHHIPLVLGSATPSVVSMYQAEKKAYHLLTLTKRPFEIKEPNVHFVDMKIELQAKNTSIFSRALKQAIIDRLNKKEQTLILFNRKGFAPFVLCRQCGHVPRCPDCEVSLTYYQDKEQLKCHYCGYEKPYVPTCEMCHQPTLKPIGVGIEYVEQQLQKTFPHARVLRMDTTVTRTKGAHEKLWYQFLNEEADILLGTQMIAKGLDFPKVTLAAVLMADLSLKVPAYNASEQTYMLLTQMAGRSGRHQMGEVFIQGYQLDHYAIQSVEKPYASFYREALFDRQIGQYEPFMKVAQFLFEGEAYLKTYQKAFTFKKQLSLLKDVVVLGPTSPFIKKSKWGYRFVITIKYQTLDLNVIDKMLETMKEDKYYVKFYPILDVL